MVLLRIDDLPLGEQQRLIDQTLGYSYNSENSLIAKIRLLLSELWEKIASPSIETLNQRALCKQIENLTDALIQGNAAQINLIIEVALPQFCSQLKLEQPVNEECLRDLFIAAVQQHSAKTSSINLTDYSISDLTQALNKQLHISPEVKQNPPSFPLIPLALVVAGASLVALSAYAFASWGSTLVSLDTPLLPSDLNQMSCILKQDRCLANVSTLLHSTTAFEYLPFTPWNSSFKQKISNLNNDRCKANVTAPLHSSPVVEPLPFTPWNSKSYRVESAAKNLFTIPSLNCSANDRPILFESTHLPFTPLVKSFTEKKEPGGFVHYLAFPVLALAGFLICKKKPAANLHNSSPTPGIASPIPSPLTRPLDLPPAQPPATGSQPNLSLVTDHLEPKSATAPPASPRAPPASNSSQNDLTSTDNPPLSRSSTAPPTSPRAQSSSLLPRDSAQPFMKPPPAQLDRHRPTTPQSDLASDDIPPAPASRASTASPKAPRTPRFPNSPQNDQTLTGTPPRAPTPIETPPLSRTHSSSHNSQDDLTLNSVVSQSPSHEAKPSAPVFPLSPTGLLANPSTKSSAADLPEVAAASPLEPWNRASAASPTGSPLNKASIPANVRKLNEFAAGVHSGLRVEGDRLIPSEEQSSIEFLLPVIGSIISSLEEDCGALGHQSETEKAFKTAYQLFQDVEKGILALRDAYISTEVLNKKPQITEELNTLLTRIIEALNSGLKACEPCENRLEQTKTSTSFHVVTPSDYADASLEDFTSYCKKYCPDISLKQAKDLARKGEDLLRKIYDPQDKSQLIPTEQDVASIIWALMQRALTRKQGFQEGAFIVEDPDSKLYQFLIRGAKQTGTAYKRISSHYPGRVATDNTHWGFDVDVKLMPASKRTLLFAEVPQYSKEGCKSALFLKPENFGTQTWEDFWQHAAEYAFSLYEKQLGHGGDDLPDMRKERVPVDVKNAFRDIVVGMLKLPQGNSITEQSGFLLKDAERNARMWGIAFMDAFVTAYQKPLEEKGLAPSLAVFKKCTQSYDNRDKRTGREVWIDLHPS